MQVASASRCPPSTRMEVLRGLRSAFPIMLGFIPFGLVLGAQARMRGFALFEVPMMTGLNFGGGSEFAAVGLWTSPPHILLIVGVTFLVNSRHLLMGAALAPHLRAVPRNKMLFCLFFMCDETWALSLTDARKTGFSLPYYMSVSLCLYMSWVIGTAIGAVAGPIMGDVSRYGFDMAFPAVFFVLLRGMWKGMASALPWGVSLGVAVAAYMVLPKGWYVPLGALSGAAVAWVQARS
ncbi:MAG: AzlC family ABC transporter permease [Acetobacter sp.]|uniref:AzlC family ABC transporter permease n=1 Tax=Acetobacter sp. TaxID=440 RepID=UPI003F93BC5A